MNRSRETGHDVNRLRRHVVFHRILARLAPAERWVLKGGFALEARLAPRARATKDLDLALLDEFADLHEELIDALADDPAGDGFSFEIRKSGEIAPDDPGNDAWRFTVRARLAGKEFASVLVDAVGNKREMAGAVEPVVVRPPVEGAGLDPVTIATVDVAQHAAEKFHAIVRRYADDRPSTRVKDLVDLVLMVETGLLPDDRLGERLRAVFDVRDGTGLPRVLPDPPSAWRSEFPALATEVGLHVTDLAEATGVVRALWDSATGDGGVAAGG